MEKIIKKPLYKSANFWFGVIGLAGTIITIYSFFFSAKADLNYKVLTNTNVLDVKEDVNKLSVVYDSIDILEHNQNISIIVLQIINEGDKDITINEYDQNSEFGIKITNGTILKKPDVVLSSNKEYYRDIVDNYNNHSVKLKYKIIDNDNFIQLKLLVLHSKNDKPIIKALGKISGIDKIDIINSNIEKSESISLKNKNALIIGISMIILLFTATILIIYFLNSTNAVLVLENEKYRLRSEEIENQILELFNSKNFLEKDSNIFENEVSVNQLTYDELLQLSKGDEVFNPRFGKGKFLEFEGKNENLSGVFIFGNSKKKLLLRLAKLYQSK